MRHLWSLVAGIVAAPLAWLLLAVGQSNAQQRIQRWEQAGVFDTANLVAPVIFLLIAGLLLGVLGTLRWSPAGPIAAGALLILPTIFMFGSPFRTLEFFSYPQPRRFIWQDYEPWLPVANGTLLVLGSLLVVAAASIQRWRRWPVLPAPIPTATDEEVIAGVGELTRDQDRPSPMSDDEILAAAAAIDEEMDRSGQRRTQPEDPARPADRTEPIERTDPAGPPPAHGTAPPEPGTAPPEPPADPQRPGPNG